VPTLCLLLAFPGGPPAPFTADIQPFAPSAGHRGGRTREGLRGSKSHLGHVSGGTFCFSLLSFSEGILREGLKEAGRKERRVKEEREGARGREAGWGVGVQLRG